MDYSTISDLYIEENGKYIFLKRGSKQELFLLSKEYIGQKFKLKPPPILWDKDTKKASYGEPIKELLAQQG